MLLFLLQVILISLSGVMAPGAVTTATIASGLKSRHAGVLIAVGHGIVEFPLMGLLIIGLGQIFERPQAQIAIGLLGGVFMVLIAIQMFRAAGKTAAVPATTLQKGPLAMGIVLTAGNPYFLLWWVTVGLALATQARDLGMLAFVLFAGVHWLCDLVWLEILSYISFKGGHLFGPRFTRIMLILCSLAMLIIAIKFIVMAAIQYTSL